MDHEKPQAVIMSRVYEYSTTEPTITTRSPVTPDIEYHRGTPSIDEVVNVEGRRERRGESLWFVVSRGIYQSLAHSATGEC